MKINRAIRLNRGDAQGQLAFWDATLKKWTFAETSELFWDDVNKRMGIGIITPQNKLEIDGDVFIGKSGIRQGLLEVNLTDDYPSYIQAIKMVADRSGLSVEYGFNGTAIGANTKNVGLYGWASEGTYNWGLWIDSGYGIFDDRVGIGTTTPDTKLQVVGDTKFGDDNTNYVSFATDGEMSLTGIARVERHLRVGAESWQKGVSAPTEGFEGVFATLDFDDTADDEAYYTLIVPHRWDSTVDIEFAVDWFYDGTQDDGTVCWNLEYKGIKAGEAVTGAGTIITQTTAGSHTTGQMVRTTFTAKILASNLEAGDTLGLRLFRDISEDTLGTNARLINTHFHFVMNKLGGQI